LFFFGGALLAILGGVIGRLADEFHSLRRRIQRKRSKLCAKPT
jgi:hypothetical protein